MADILDLTDARKALRLPAADTSNDADLTSTYIPAVTSVVEDVTGPVMSAGGRTWTTDGGGYAICLPYTVTAVTTITENGATLVEANGDFTVNLSAGIVYRGGQRAPRTFLWGRQNIVITYAAGAYASAAAVPANIRLAARIILNQMWTADQQGLRPQFGTPQADLVATPSGFLIPNRAYELLRGDVDDGGGFA